VSDAQLRAIAERVKTGDRAAAVAIGAALATGVTGVPPVSDAAGVPSEVGYGHGV
jgi:hypothetical protein